MHLCAPPVAVLTDDFISQYTNNTYEHPVFYGSLGILAVAGLIDFSIASLKEFKKERDYEREYKRKELERQERLRLLNLTKHPTIDDKVK